MQYFEDILFNSPMNSPRVISTIDANLEIKSFIIINSETAKLIDEEVVKELEKENLKLQNYSNLITKKFNKLKKRLKNKASWLQIVTN